MQGETPSRKAELLPHVIAVIAAAVFLLVSAYALRLDPAVASGDFLTVYMPRIHLLQADPLDLNRWVDPFYPVGYNFLILALGPHLGFVTAAKAVSVLAGVLLFVPVFGLARRVFGLAIAGWVVALLATNRQLYRFAHWEGPDLFAVALQFWGLWLLLMPARRPRVTLSLSGACLGGAFLMRYQTALLIAVSFGFLAYLNRREPRTALSRASLFLVSAGLVASPQLVANLAVRGSPLPGFPESGAVNAYLYVSGDLRTWWLAQQGVSASGEPTAPPSRAAVARQAVRHVFSDLLSLELLPQPLAAFAWGGLLVAWSQRRYRQSADWQLLVIATCTWVAGLSWYVIHERGMLLLAPLLTISGGFLLWTSVRRLAVPALRSSAPHVVLSMVVALTAWWNVRPQLWAASYDRTPLEVTRALRTAGMRAPTEVGAVSFGPIYDADSNDVQVFPFIVARLVQEGVQDWEGLVAFACRERLQFLVADEGADRMLLPTIRLLSPAARPAGVELLFLKDDPPRTAVFDVRSACAANAPE